MQCTSAFKDSGNWKERGRGLPVQEFQGPLVEPSQPVPLHPPTQTVHMGDLVSEPDPPPKGVLKEGLGTS